MILVVLASMNEIQCSSEDDDIYAESKRFKDISSALDFIHDELSPDHVPPEEMCRRYAVLLNMAAATGLPYESSVIELIKLDTEQLNEHYREIDTDSLSSLYMKATEKFRASRLSPPFLEIIECLKGIDTPVVKKYLEDQELRIIIDLYRQILGLDSKTTNSDNIDLTKFHPTFLTTIRNLFEDQLDVDFLLKTTRIRPYKPNVNRQLVDSETIAALDAWDPQQDLEIKRMKQVLRQRSYRERHLIRQREQSRLAQRRMRMLNPEQMRERNRLHKQEQRKRMRETRFELSILTPEEKRARRLEKRRERRRMQRLAEQQQKQQQLQPNSTSIERLRAEREPYMPPEINQTEQQLKRKQYYIDLLSGLQQNDQPQQQQHSQEPPVPAEPLIEVYRPTLRTASWPYPREQAHYTTVRPPANPTITSPESNDHILPSIGPPDAFLSPGLDQLRKNDSQVHLYDGSFYDFDLGSNHYLTDSQARDYQGQFSPMSAFQSFEESEEECQAHKDLINCATQLDNTDTILQLLSDHLQASGATSKNDSPTASASSPPTDPEENKS